MGDKEEGEDGEQREGGDQVDSHSGGLHPEVNSRSNLADGKAETQSVAEEEQKKEGKDPASGSAVSAKKQTSLASLFAKQLRNAVHSQIVPATDADQLTKQCKTPLATVSSSLPPAPKLSSVGEFVIKEEETPGERRVLTPLERFQQRLMQQMTGAGRGSPGDHEKGRGGRKEREGAVMVKSEAGEIGEEVGETGKGDGPPKPLISEDVISKLKDKPG